MKNLKDLLLKKELRFYYFFYLIFTMLAFAPRFIDKFHSSKLTNNPKIIIAHTTEAFIDFKFSNLIPYLEPNGMDHYSYTPKRINYINNIVKNYYGYDLLKENKKDKECDYDYYRSSYLNTCITKKFWQNLTKKEWLLIANETKVNYVISSIKLSNLYLCEEFENKTDNSKYFYYYIAIKESPNKYCYQINQR